MLGAIFFQIAAGTAGRHDPEIAGGVEAAANDSAPQQHFAAQLVDFFCARLPHHSRSQSRISEGVDQGLHHLRAVFGLLAKKRVLEGRNKRLPNWLVTQSSNVFGSRVGFRRARMNENMQSVDSIKPSFDSASNGFRG